MNEVKVRERLQGFVRLSEGSASLKQGKCYVVIVFAVAPEGRHEERHVSVYHEKRTMK